LHHISASWPFTACILWDIASFHPYNARIFAIYVEFLVTSENLLTRIQSTVILLITVMELLGLFPTALFLFGILLFYQFAE